MAGKRCNLAILRVIKDTRAVSGFYDDVSLHTVWLKCSWCCVQNRRPERAYFRVWCACGLPVSSKVVLMCDETRIRVNIQLGWEKFAVQKGSNNRPHVACCSSTSLLMHLLNVQEVISESQNNKTHLQPSKKRHYYDKNDVRCICRGV